MATSPVPGRGAGRVLIVLTGTRGASDAVDQAVGVDGSSFITSFLMLQSLTKLPIDVATPSKAPPMCVTKDSKLQQWLASHAAVLEAVLDVATVSLADYAVIVFPAQLGAAADLADSPAVCNLVTEALAAGKVVCAVASGVAALCSAAEAPQSRLRGHAATCAPMRAERDAGVFDALPCHVEDRLRAAGLAVSIASAATDAPVVHVQVSGSLVTAQTSESTVLAMHNVLYLLQSGAKSGAVRTTKP